MLGGSAKNPRTSRRSSSLRLDFAALPLLHLGQKRCDRGFAIGAGRLKDSSELPRRVKRHVAGGQMVPR